MSKRKAIAVVIGAAVFAIVGASAATLGGIQTNNLGANSNVVEAQIENGVRLSWQTAYSSSESAYTVTGITLSTIDGAESIPGTAQVKVTLVDANGDALGEFVSANGGSTWTAPSGAVLAADVYGASVVINGGSVTAVSTAP